MEVISMKHTKERILDEALALFSIQGYDNTSVADIASKLDIKAAALYKHYDNKQAVFEAIIKKVLESYTAYMQRLNLNGFDFKEDAQHFKNISEEALIQIALQLFNYFLHDKEQQMFRKMMVIEQYHNQSISKMYIKQYILDPLHFQSKMFEQLIEKRFFKQSDSKVMAMQFFAPIYMYLNLCDSQPDFENEALEMIKKHIYAFNSNYKHGGLL